MALAKLGRALKRSGLAAAALVPLREARERFERFAAKGDVAAERMASVCLTEMGDCLTALGRFDEAAAAYEKRALEADSLKDPRGAAVSRGQLGTVRMYQRCYDLALSAWNEARQIFEGLGEPGSVAIAWHQIGMVHHEAARLDAAEQAYQKSLELQIRQGNRSGEASSLNQLGSLYSLMGRLEEAVRFYRDAATIFAEVGDEKSEGITRKNVADDLVKLGRYGEAREEINRAIQCKAPFGHAAMPWTSYKIKHDLERAVGDVKAAAKARQQAFDAFLAYRRDGGENHTGAGRLVAAAGQAIVAGEVEGKRAELEEVAGQEGLPSYLQFLIPALQQILTGSRDPSLAANPALDYDDAVELQLLLERLAASRPA